MDKITLGTLILEFPEEMTKEEIDWITDQMCRFLERHSVKVSKKDE
ncbi:MAG: hypothetical protein QF814_02135 [Candidatus Marinimicrobia bacterium]|jgi:hypothetical protein|nr:hypothetical protein [Candidatus Neomarinimicrobiota bacterium]|tara:strand:+ start:2537 stop:2674 length:138 start_codon:yes stop_codon:yes gene_type:complete